MKVIFTLLIAIFSYSKVGSQSTAKALTVPKHMKVSAKAKDLVKAYEKSHHTEKKILHKPVHKFLKKPERVVSDRKVVKKVEKKGRKSTAELYREKRKAAQAKHDARKRMKIAEAHKQKKKQMVSKKQNKKKGRKSTAELYREKRKAAQAKHDARERIKIAEAHKQKKQHIISKHQKRSITMQNKLINRYAAIERKAKSVTRK